MARQSMSFQGEIIINLSQDDADRSGADVAAQSLKKGLVVYDNFTVFGLAGDANDPDLQEKICEVKGVRRGKKQPLGWTVPFDRSLQAIDLCHVKSRQLKALLSKASVLTSLIGGICFLRAHGNMDFKHAAHVPDCLMPENETVQLYSPEGIVKTDRFIRRALALGAEPSMTSANVSGSLEITGIEDAESFSERNGIICVINYTKQKLQKPHGSYPIVLVGEQNFSIIREGCFGNDILKALFDGFEVRIPDDIRPSNFAAGVLHLLDLPVPARKLRGALLRDALLDYMYT